MISQRERGRRGGLERTRQVSEFDQRVLELRRTARVVAGGRRFSFRAVVVVGNRKGTVGIGVGKGQDVSRAVEKATYQAKKKMFHLVLTEDQSIPHEVVAKFAAARVMLKPGEAGRGLIGGGPVRVVADLAGIKNLSAKILGRTSNKLNNAYAVMKALQQLRMRERHGERDAS